MTVTWLLATVMGDNKIEDTKKSSKIAGNFDHHGDAAVQCRAPCPMEHTQGFTRSHWMLLLGECLCHIAPAAAMVSNYGGKRKSLQKQYF
jgi:hypothetical protein